MAKRKFYHRKDYVHIRDWQFDRLIGVLKTREWKLVITNFKEIADWREDEDYDLTLGLTDWSTHTICVRRGKSLTVCGEVYYFNSKETLIHELCHVLFQDTLLNEIYILPKSRYLKNNRWSKPGRRLQGRHAENRVEEFAGWLYAVLSRKQKNVLKRFIQRAPRMIRKK